MNEVSNHKEAGTITRHSNLTIIMQLNVGPADIAKRCGMLSQWCGVFCLTKQLMELNEQYSVNCEVLYFVLRLFPFESFYEENGFYVFKCNIP